MSFYSKERGLIRGRCYILTLRMRVQHRDAVRLGINIQQDYATSASRCRSRVVAFSKVKFYDASQWDLVMSLGGQFAVYSICWNLAVRVRLESVFPL